MSYLLQSNRKKKPGKVAFLSFIFLALVLFALNTVLGGSLSSLARVPAELAWSARASVLTGVQPIETALRTKQSLVLENANLQKRIRELELYALNNQIVVTENTQLRRLLGVDSGDSIQAGILATVHSAGGVVPFGVLLAKNETRASVAVGSIAYADDTIAIGRVVQSSGEGSVAVELFSAPSVETRVMLVDEERPVAFTLVGNSLGNLVAQVARDADVREGDVLVLRSNPRAVVGVVGSVETTATEAFQTVRVRTPVNLSTLQYIRLR